MSLEISYRPLACFRTCRHLVRQRSTDGSGWYAACSLGEEPDRVNWARVAGEERLRGLEQLRHRVAEAVAPDVERLVRLKRQQLQAEACGTPPAEHLAALRAQAEVLMTGIDEVLDAERELLAQVQLPRQACRELLRATVESLERSPTGDFQFDVPLDLIERFPAEARILFQPSFARCAVAQAAPATS